ncbi:MAG: class I SAM-dependent methyltransferase [Verrucomicrobia bacterium]|nr:class I SAM-dependent methyltransferase [Verrucomicrobiota bacterium]
MKKEYDSPRRNPKSEPGKGSPKIGRPNRPVHGRRSDHDETTSWETSASWYDKAVGPKGHYYHQHVIIPNLLRLANFDPKGKNSLLDLACGQGILSRHIPKEVAYVGIDTSPSLISSARRESKRPDCQFHIGDLSKPLELQKSFTHAVCLLAAQNIEDLPQLFSNASRYLEKGGRFICVINHPCFRIPRQSHWEVDLNKKTQYRRIDLYMSSLKIPIQTHPSQQNGSPSTWSFHRPLSVYSAALKQAGLMIDAIEEWCSDKQSSGKMAAMENRSRKEFPLFLALSAIKLG